MPIGSYTPFQPYVALNPQPETLHPINLKPQPSKKDGKVDSPEKFKPLGLRRLRGALRKGCRGYTALCGGGGGRHRELHRNICVSIYIYI